MYQLCELGTSLCECFLIHLLFQNWFGKRELRRWKFWLAYVLFFSVNCIYTLLPLLPAVRAVAGLVCVFVIALCVYKTSPFTAFLGSVVYVAMTVLAEYIVMAGLSFAAYDTARLLEYGKERVLYNTLSKIVNLVVVLISSLILGKNHAELTARQVLAFLPCHFISIYICHIFYQTSAGSDSLPLSFVIVLLGMLYMNFMVVVLISQLSVRARLQREQALAEQQFALQKTYYEQVQRDQEETHALWHDIKKYMTAMEAMVSTGNHTDAMKELTNARKTFAHIGNLVDIGNPELNAILNHYVHRASAQNIQIKLEAFVPEQLSISAIDLSVIIGNTVDNAMEACLLLPLEQRVISIMLSHRNHMLFYNIQNPYLPDQPKKPGNIHGYGLKNVEACVKKYDGSLSVEREAQTYVVSVRLNCK